MAADVRILNPLELEITNARRSFLAADEAGDYVAGDYWFAELQRLYEQDSHTSHHHPDLPVQR